MTSDPLQRVAEIVVGLGEAGPQPHRLFVVRDRVAVATQFMQDVGQIVMGLGIARSRRDRPLVMDDGDIVLAERVQHAGEVVVDLGIIGPDAQRVPGNEPRPVRDGRERRLALPRLAWASASSGLIAARPPHDASDCCQFPEALKRQPEIVVRGCIVWVRSRALSGNGRRRHRHHP